MSMSAERPELSGQTVERGWYPDGVRHDDSWNERIKRHRQSFIPTSYGAWQPDPLPTPPPIALRPAIEPAFDPVRPGLMRLYAARMAHADSQRAPIRESHSGNRLLVGELAGEDGPVRTLALVRPLGAIGRGCGNHYERLHPPLNMRYRRFRIGSLPQTSVHANAADGWNAPKSSPASSMGLLRSLATNTFYPRLGGTKHMLLATFFAVVLLLGAASSSLAGGFF